MPLGSARPVGIYEKALPADLAWEERLRLAAEAGYDFVEISVDESDARLARLNWTASQRAALRQAIANTGVPIMSMCLSGHRRYSLGSASPEIRKQGLEIFHRAIEFATDIGLRIIQVMGYDVFYEPSDAGTEAHFLEGLRQGSLWAAQAGVMLGLENVDCELVDSVEKALRFVRIVDSPWFHLYPDIGNLFAAGYSPPDELRLAAGHLVAIHVKDARPGVIRRVPFEEGGVPFDKTFQTLPEIGFRGPMVVEMWSQVNASGDPLSAIIAARKLVDRLVAATSAD